MPILGNNVGRGDESITSMLPADIEARRQALRQALIASRGSSYTYKDPDAVAGRAGGSIGNDGTITINMGSRSSRPGPFSNTPGWSGQYAGDDTGGGGGFVGGGEGTGFHGGGGHIGITGTATGFTGANQFRGGSIFSRPGDRTFGGYGSQGFANAYLNRGDDYNKKAGGILGSFKDWVKSKFK